MSLLQIFLVIIAITLSGAVLLFDSWAAFSTPSSIFYITNLPALSSSCIAIASFLLHLVLAVRTPPPKLTNQDSRFLPYKQYFMFGLTALTTIPNALACVTLFRCRDLDQNLLTNVVKSVCLLHGFLVETWSHTLSPSLSLSDVREEPRSYRMKHQWIRRIKLARVTVTVATVLQVSLLVSGAICLFVIDFDYEVLWLLPCLMLWTQFALSIVMTHFGTTAKSARPLKLSIVFYGITTVASSGLAAAGIALHWQLTFVEQYLFLQALLVWTSYRLMTVIHNLLPTRASGRDDIKTTPGSSMTSSRRMDIVVKPTDEKEDNGMFWSFNGEALHPDSEIIEMAGILKRPERIYQYVLSRIMTRSSISRVSNQPIQARTYGTYCLAVFRPFKCHVLHGWQQSHFETRKERAVDDASNSIMESFVHFSPHDQVKDSNGSLDSLRRIIELMLVLAPATRMSTPLYSGRVTAQELTYLFRLTEKLKAKDSIKSLVCSIVEAKYEDDTSDVESPHQVNMFPVLEKYDPARALHNPPNTSPIMDTPMLKDDSDCGARLRVPSCSSHVEESDRRLREEGLAKRASMPMPVAINHIGGESGAGVAEKTPSRVKVSRQESIAVPPFVSESSQNCEYRLEGNNATEEGIRGDLFTRPK
ncbi:hypothetical protein F4604DRAFT_1676345 [Suillus subluteus]|nr:hypothetical protein F4604DRAFT_1676345 [Suillus subluteus]